MGQPEVYEWLKFQRIVIKNEQYFTIAEVVQGLKDIGIKEGLDYTRMHLIKLCVSKHVEYKDMDRHGISNYKKVFRFKNG